MEKPEDKMILTVTQHKGHACMEGRLGAYSFDLLPSRELPGLEGYSRLGPIHYLHIWETGAAKDIALYDGGDGGGWITRPESVKAKEVFQTIMAKASQAPPFLDVGEGWSATMVV